MAILIRTSPIYSLDYIDEPLTMVPQFRRNLDSLGGRPFGAFIPGAEPLSIEYQHCGRIEAGCFLWG